MPDIALNNNTAQHRDEIASGATLAGFAEWLEIVRPGARATFLS